MGKNIVDHIPLVIVDRSGTIECVHRGSVVVSDGSRIVKSFGNPGTITPCRSTAKPIQIVPLIARGAIDAFQLQSQDIAFMVSSHNGERAHIDAARSILYRAGLHESQLTLGSHPPFLFELNQQLFNEFASGPQPIHNNCSGKHIGMLLLGKLMGVPLSEYWKESHPIQQEIIACVEGIFKSIGGVLSLGIDGCGVPTFNVRLESLAFAYAKIAHSDLDKEVLGMVATAMIRNPFMVAGSARLDTDLMRLKPLVAKAGAQGVYCLALPETGLGIAIKIESGSEPASETVAVEVLRQLGVVSGQDLERLDQYWHLPVKTWTGRLVGSYRPVFE